MKKNTSTTTTTPATRSKAQKFEILVLIAAAVLFVLMLAGKMHWIPGIIGAAYLALWLFCTFVKDTTVTQLFCEKKAKAKKKEKPADTADVDPMDPGKKPDADKLSDAKANAWTKVIAYRDAKEFAVWQEKAKLDPAKAPKGKVYDADTNCYIDEPKSAPDAAAAFDEAVFNRLVTYYMDKEKMAEPDAIMAATAKLSGK